MVLRARRLLAASVTGTATAGDFVASRIVAATADGEYVAGYTTRDGLVIPGSCGVWKNGEVRGPGEIGSREITVHARCDNLERRPLPLGQWRWERTPALVDALRLLDESAVAESARIRTGRDGQRRLELKHRDTWLGARDIDARVAKITAVLEVADGYLIRAFFSGPLWSRDDLWKVSWNRGQVKGTRQGVKADGD